jgi:hypothetical protein
MTRIHPTSSTTALFDDVFLGGFECSCQRLEDGRRIDMQASTRHDELAAADYARLRSAGMTACRDGVSWPFVERAPGVFDFRRFGAMLRAADHARVDAIWDLMHFGWPDDVDVFAPSFPARFGRYARALAQFLAGESERRVLITPINEMSFLAWAAGDVRCMDPFEAARGVELKAQLVRATIEGIEAIRDVLPAARFLQPEPAIRIAKPPAHRKMWARVESDNLLQYQAWDMLAGRVWPSLGGAEKYLDIIGVNYYPDNQFTPQGDVITHDDVRYEPFGAMLMKIWHRYQRPMIISETGSEGDGRAPWIRYVSNQCVAALRQGCELHGVTLYPVVNHPGWLDGRHCHNGLWDYADAQGERVADPRLLEELLHQRGRLYAARAAMLVRRSSAMAIGAQ